MLWKFLDVYSSQIERTWNHLASEHVYCIHLHLFCFFYATRTYFLRTKKPCPTLSGCGIQVAVGVGNVALGREVHILGESTVRASVVWGTTQRNPDSVGFGAGINEHGTSKSKQQQKTLRLGCQSILCIFAYPSMWPMCHTSSIYHLIMLHLCCPYSRSAPFCLWYLLH